MPSSRQTGSGINYHHGIHKILKKRPAKLLKLVLLFIFLLSGLYRLRNFRVISWQRTGETSVDPRMRSQSQEENTPIRRFESTLTLPAKLPVALDESKVYIRKTLVILFGNLRCGELAWKSFYDNLLNLHAVPSTSLEDPNIELALVIGDVAEPYRNATLLDRAKYVFRFEEHDDWGEALDQIDPNWRSTVAPLINSKSNILGGAKLKSWEGSGAISFWIRWFIARVLVQEDLLSKYERFVVTRVDHYYMCAHDIHRLDPQYLWVPEGEDFYGINDRHLVVSSRDILKALDILPGFFQDPHSYPLNDTMYNAESLLWDRWKREGLADRVRRFPRVMFTCGNAHLEDSTRWKIPSEVVPEGVRLKYRQEYRLSHRTCQKPW